MKTLHEIIICVCACLVIISLAMGLDYMGTHTTTGAAGWVYAGMLAISCFAFWMSLMSYEQAKK